MGERPIIFSGPVVVALLAGRKTQTRRIFIPPAPFDIGDDITIELATGSMKARYAVGDRLWVRENWWSDFAVGGHEHGYLADGEPYAGNASVKRGSSMMMPRRLSRLTLDVTEVRVQRLQDISEEDAIAEGVTTKTEENIRKWGYDQHKRMAFADLWETLHGAGSWDQNPWVAAVTFEVHRRNIDAPALRGALSPSVGEGA